MHASMFYEYNSIKITFLVHSLCFSGWQEANHLHRLLQPFKIMTQIFLILDLKVFLKKGKKEGETVSREGQKVRS